MLRRTCRKKGKRDTGRSASIESHTFSGLYTWLAHQTSAVYEVTLPRPLRAALAADAREGFTVFPVRTCLAIVSDFDDLYAPFNTACGSRTPVTGWPAFCAGNGLEHYTSLPVYIQPRSHLLPG
jgi:hypothetical protein